MIDNTACPSKQRQSVIPPTTCLPLLHQEKVHCSIGNDDKDTGEDDQSNHISPQSKGVESKCAENRGARYFDIETVAVVDQREIRDLVHEQSFQRVVEDGELQGNCQYGDGVTTVQQTYILQP